MQNSTFGDIQARFLVLSEFCTFGNLTQKGNNMWIIKFEKNVLFPMDIHCRLDVVELFIDDKFSYIKKLNNYNSVSHEFSVTQD